MKKIISVLLIMTLALSLAGCGEINMGENNEAGNQGSSESFINPDDVISVKEMKGKDLMAGVTARNVISETLTSEEDLNKLADEALELFKASVKTAENPKNALVSPLSVTLALGMTINGAANNTLAQFSEHYGVTPDELSVIMKRYTGSLSSNEKCKVNIANGIWFKDDENFYVEKDFLQKNADYYNAAARLSPFDDSTKQEINDYISDNTQGMVKDVLDRIDKDAIMYLVNALSFDGKWSDVYNEYNVSKNKFTDYSGMESEVDMMYGQEKSYLENADYTGFMKYYESGDYAFVALLPKDEGNFDKALSNLMGSEIRDLIKSKKTIKVNTMIPKFTADFSADLSEAFKACGVTDAFDANLADFSKLGHYANANIVINRILHKTHIEVCEGGTKAAAATVVEMTKATAVYDPTRPEEVYLDRPFLYMIVDTKNSMPLFIGKLDTVE